MKVHISKDEVKKLFKQNLYQVLLVFVAFTIMILVSVFYVGNIVSSQMLDLAEQTITTTETAVNGTLEASGLLFSDVVRTTAEKIEAAKDDPEAETIVDDYFYGNMYNKLQHEILEYLRSVQEYYEKVNSPIPEFMKIYGYIDGKFLDGSNWPFGPEYEPTKRVWYTGAINNGGDRYFSEPYEDADTGDMCISFSQVIGDIEKDVDTDVLAIDLDLTGITGYVQTQEIANKGYGLLVSDQYTFAAHRNESYLGTHMRDAGGEYAKLFEMLDAGEAVSGFRFRDYDGVSSVSFFHMLFNGWYIGIITPYSSYTSAVTMMTITISVIGAALAVLLSALLLRSSYKRIKSEEESQSKSTFLARMSHEMRTPMNAIIGMTEIARATQDPEKIEYCMDKINVASKHLLGVINDVLDMSKIEADKLKISLSDFPLYSVVDQVKTVMSFKLEEKKQTLEVSIDGSVPEAIISDEQRLAQVLTNLISNANKFSPENSIIKLNVSAEMQNDRYLLHFDIIDKGIGISEEAKERLFNSFEQADGSISRKFGGTGLGLSISKRIVVMLGGDIGVESKLGEGSRFYFSITAEKGNAKMQPAESGESQRIEIVPNMFSDKHILIAEDVQINIEILMSLLEETGINVDAAENGKIAVELFEANPEKYDLIFMDMQMPEMDGLDATRNIRASNHPRAKTIPIVAMTANVFKEDIDRCRDAGMNDHTGKPIEILDVVGKIIKYTK